MLTTDQRHLSVICVCVCVCARARVCVLSRVWLFAAPWPVALQAPPSMGFSRQEYCSGLPSFSRGSSGSRVKPASPALGGGFFTPVPPGKQFYLTFTSHLIEMPAYDWNVDPVLCQAPGVRCSRLRWGIFSYRSCLTSDVINTEAESLIWRA